MNTYEALERKSDGRWDYTRNGRPTGYCREYIPLDPKLDYVTNEDVEKYNSTSHKHHTDGHATKEEACACYKEYLLDHNLKFSSTSNQKRKCQICDEWTQGMAEIDCRMFFVCDEHANRESIEKIHGPVGESWSSW